MRIQVVLKKGRSEPIRRGHPWVFSGAIGRYPECEEGTLVDVLDSEGDFLGRGHYHQGSIAVRMLTLTEQEVDVNFWRQRLGTALMTRKSLGLMTHRTNAFRWIHGEGDFLPGLIIDVYGEVVVIQCHTLGMSRHLSDIQNAILNIPDMTGVTSIYFKVPAVHGLPLKEEFGWGSVGQAVIQENGHLFYVDVVAGQKTGFFLDQRENRSLVSTLAQGKKMTNLFSYSGGFSVYAAKAGAREVISVDVSAKAIEWAERNMEINGVSVGHRGIVSDVMDYLKGIPDESEEVMVVDPPAFAKSRKRSHNAVQAYKRLNALALKKMKKEAWMLTFSCSQVVHTQLFLDTITAAAIECGRSVQVVKQLSQGGDHPVNIFHPEGKYLKGLLLRVG